MTKAVAKSPKVSKKSKAKKPKTERPAPPTGPSYMRPHSVYVVVVDGIPMTETSNYDAASALMDQYKDLGKNPKLTMIQRRKAA